MIKELRLTYSSSAHSTPFPRELATMASQHFVVDAGDLPKGSHSINNQDTFNWACVVLVLPDILRLTAIDKKNPSNTNGGFVAPFSLSR